jgi:3-deoxy-7-phosphoheptulonate synthase
MKKGVGEKEIEDVLARLEKLDLRGHLSRGVERTVIGVIGKTYPELRDSLELLPGVEEAIPISRPYKLSSREFKQEDTLVSVVLQRRRNRLSPLHER